MNYESIKQELINNEIYKKVKDYSKNKSNLKTYYNVGKMLYQDGKHYGEGIIKKYSDKLTSELGKGYTYTNLSRMRQFYVIFENVATVWQQLSWSHYKLIIPIEDEAKRNYYINECINNNLSVRELIKKIKDKEYERLDNKTIGIIMTKRDNKYVMEYCSDHRIFNTTYLLQKV